MSGRADRTVEKSPKHYGVAVALCGVFGVIGVNNFYIGNWLHGLFDLGLFLLFLGFLWAGDDFFLYAVLVIAIDTLHTFYVFYRLIIGKQLDGEGRLITWSD